MNAEQASGPTDLVSYWAVSMIDSCQSWRLTNNYKANHQCRHGGTFMCSLKYVTLVDMAPLFHLYTHA